MAKKTWSELSDTYRRRLERGGITAEKHAAGESLQVARGHASTQILAQFKRLGGYHHVNRVEFEKMPKKNQAFVAELYILGFMTEGSPAPQENRDARYAFLGWKQLNETEWDEEDWKKYKHDYHVKFGR